MRNILYQRLAGHISCVTIHFMFEVLLYNILAVFYFGSLYLVCISKCSHSLLWNYDDALDILLRQTRGNHEIDCSVAKQKLRK